METFLDFITFKDSNVLYVVLGMFCITASSALIGTFAFLRKRALIGDAIAHSLLPGVCLGFMVSGEKNMLFLFLGAFITGWISTFLVDYIVNRSKVKQDAAIGIVLSTFFALGIVLLTFIQNSNYTEQGGLNSFLFGQAAAINKSEIILFVIILIIVVVLIIAMYRQFIIVSFNSDYAKSIGLPVRSIEFLMTSLTVLAIASGIQALGVVLMSALIVTPAAAARFWTNNLFKMLLIAVSFSVFSGWIGAYVSYANAGMPTGPWVVMILSFITLLSFLGSTKSGILARYLRAQRNKRKILHENILKAIYQLHELHEQEKHLNLSCTASEILSIRLFDTGALQKGLNRLEKRELIKIEHNQIALTPEGAKESRRIVRLHRLWEQYLLKRTTIDTFHVHSGAEAIEHILSPEIERELEKELGISGIPKEDF
ncbi:metal ABC transporter permease [Crocinitomix sp.]|nr:metal ABC transporter permease [Crocinitomix sp.]